MHPTKKQTTSEKAFEYAIGVALSDVTGVTLRKNRLLTSAQTAYASISSDERTLSNQAAEKAAAFLNRHDKRLREAKTIALRPKFRGHIGGEHDVAIALNGNGELSVSAKNEYATHKHGVLSDEIDFGYDWGKRAVSTEYFNRVRPIFSKLRKLREHGASFSDITDRELTVYLPVLAALEDELNQLCGGEFIPALFAYFAGKHDFYRIIKRNNEMRVFVESMNLHKTLDWGGRLKLPEHISFIKRDPCSNHSLLVAFQDGWQILLRLRNATKKVEPYLKLDMHFAGVPIKFSRHEMLLA